MTGRPRVEPHADGAAVERLLAALVAIDSVNPDLVPGRAVGARWPAGSAIG